MLARKAHRGLSLVALAAYLLNLAVVAGGAVVCQDPQGRTRFELACDHGHCGPSGTLEHDHDDPAETCWCAVCPCEDLLLGISFAATLRGEEWHATLLSSAHGAFAGLEPGSAPENRGRLVCLRRPSPAVDQTLRRLRTIVLIV